MTTTSSTRLIFVTPNYGHEFGGVGASAQRIVASLRLDYDLSVITLNRELPPGRRETERAPGVTIHRFGPFSDTAETTQRICDAVIGEAREQSAGVVIGFYLCELSYAALLAARLIEVPALMMARGNDIDYELFGPKAPLILHQLEHADLVCCVTTEMQRKVSTWAPRARAVCVANGIDPVHFPPLESERPADRTVIGMFGEVKPKKGLSLLLEAIDFSRFSLRIIGRLSDRCAAMLHGFLTLHPELVESVSVIPYVKKHLDLLAEYRRADIVCIPSLHDGMPNVLLEAMSCERIVVASDVGGALDVIKHRENGYLFPRGDRAALRGALAEAADSARDPARRMRQSARRTIVENFNWERERTEYRTLLDQLLAGRQSPRRAAAG